VSGEMHVIESEKRAFYTTRSLAERLSVSLGTAKTIIREGEIPVYRIRGAVRIDPADVDSYLAKHRETRSAA
jgi:excisionase family DNA binding protein